MSAQLAPGSPLLKPSCWWEQDSNAGPPALKSTALTTRPLYPVMWSIDCPIRSARLIRSAWFAADVTGAAIRVAQAADVTWPGAGDAGDIRAAHVDHPHPACAPVTQRDHVQTAAPEAVHYRWRARGGMGEAGGRGGGGGGDLRAAQVDHPHPARAPVTQRDHVQTTTPEAVHYRWRPGGGVGSLPFPVIPLSTNSGLIGWVPHCDTLHALIRDYREKKKILLNIEHRIMLRVSHTDVTSVGQRQFTLTSLPLKFIFDVTSAQMRLRSLPVRQQK